jgi:hypothetical protein
MPSTVVKLLAVAEREGLRRAIRTGRFSRTLFVDARWVAVVVIAVVGGSMFAASVGLTRTRPRPAPPASALPLVPHARVIDSAAGASEIDTGYDHHRYRYMVVAGISGARRTQLLASETRLMIRDGWNHELSSVLVPGSDPAVFRRVPVTRPGANVLINAPNQKIYAALDAIKSWRDAEQQTDGTPLSNTRSIRRALMRHEPVLFVALGNGRHGRL